MERLDGNAIAGTLFEVFGREMTTTVGTCGGCGWLGPLAEVAVYLIAPGVITRCPHCDNLLMVIVDRRGMACVELGGFASLAEPRVPRGPYRRTASVVPDPGDAGR